MYISRPIYLWLIVSSLIVIYDASYILLRPHSIHAKGPFFIYQPYQLYTQYDTLYGNNDNWFVKIVAVLNLVEISLAFLAVALSLSDKKQRKLKGAFLAIISSAFVFWKTVIYMGYDIDYVTDKVKNMQIQSLWLYHIPNYFWIVCPLASIYSIGKRIGSELISKNKKE